MFILFSGLKYSGLSLIIDLKNTQKISNLPIENFVFMCYT